MPFCLTWGSSCPHACHPFLASRVLGLEGLLNSASWGLWRQSTLRETWAEGRIHRCLCLVLWGMPEGPLADGVKSQENECQIFLYLKVPSFEGKVSRVHGLHLRPPPSHPAHIPPHTLSWTVKAARTLHTLLQKQKPLCLPPSVHPSVPGSCLM